MRRLGLIVLAVALAAALAACGEEELAEPDPSPAPEPTEPDEPEPTDPDEDEGATRETPTPAETPAPDEPEEADGAEAVTVYYARDHESGVWVEPEVVPLDEPTVAVARAAMEALVGRQPREPGRTTLAADGAQVRDVALDAGVLVVDFAGLVDDGLGAAYEEALVQQIAHTGGQFDTVGSVRILVDGKELETLAGHVDVSQPVEPDPFALSPITFTSHASGDSVAVGDVTVAGEACTFEANVQLELRAPDGSTAEETFTTASIACPERGEWEHTFALAEPGTWTIVATEPDPSAGEGRPPFETTLELAAQ